MSRANLVQQVPSGECRVTPQSSPRVPFNSLRRKSCPECKQIGARTPDQRSPTADHKIVPRMIERYAMHNYRPIIQQAPSIKFEHLGSRRGIGALTEMNDVGSVRLPCWERSG